MFLHFLPRDGRESTPDASKEQPQIFVNFGRRAHGGSWITRIDLLFNSDGRRQALDKVALGFAHPTQELTCISRQRFHIPTLSFGIERVESQGRFARPAHTGNGNKLISRDIKVHIFEIVDACTFDFDIFLHLNHCLLRSDKVTDFYRKAIRNDLELHGSPTISLRYSFRLVPRLFVDMLGIEIRPSCFCS